MPKTRPLTTLDRIEHEKNQKRTRLKLAMLSIINERFGSLKSFAEAGGYDYNNLWRRLDTGNLTVIQFAEVAQALGMSSKDIAEVIKKVMRC